MSKGISEQEIEDVEELSSPRTPVIYEVVRRIGDEEMARPATSLWWSGVAAGLSMSFSLLAQAMLETHLPDTPWRPLVAGFGYCVGFLMAVLGRQQLFTESTITVVLPVFANLNGANIWRMVRLWTIVLVANLAGTLIAALICSYTPVLRPDLLHGMLTISRGLLALGWWDMFFRAISSGFLIAAMVWMIPSAESAKFSVITLMTYLDRDRRLHPYRRRQHGSLHARARRRLGMVADDQPVRGAGTARQHRRRYRAVRADLLCASDGGDLSA
jgi:formate/nitrite transporter FocA (FNT family)